MLINLMDVLTSEGKTEEKQIALEKSSFSYQGREYLIQESKPLVLKLCNLEDGKAGLQGQTRFRILMPCDRCLKDVTVDIQISFDRQVYAPERTAELSEEEQDEQNFMEGCQLNIEQLINNEIMLNWPTKVLCREDCRGICSVCGKDLNNGECGCDTFVPDPRMAKIKDIFHAGKEV